ncbi:ABC transporter permease subunit [Patescibacteria group bacterium]|nr:ABC transporter permease subunit [Patescibacteria group bacterium]
MAHKFVAMLVSDSVQSSYTAIGTVWPHLGATVLKVLIGLLWGTWIGVPIGVFMGSFKGFGRFLEPSVGVARVIPVTALGALFYRVFGMGDATNVAMVTYATSLLMVVGAVEGIRATENTEIVEAAKLDGASAWGLIRHITAELALPQIYANIRVSYQLGIVLMIVLEQYSHYGLGAVLYKAQLAYRVDEAWAIIVLLGILGFAVDYGLRRLRPWLISW